MKLPRAIDPFLLALVCAVGLAMILPVHGTGLNIVNFAVTILIALLFFFQGVRLPRSAVVAALAHWRLHGTIFATTFALFPLIGIALHVAVPSLLAPALWTGILFLCALPSTVQSSVAFTSMAGGNVAAAVAAAAGSNIIGIGLTPALLAGLLSAQGVSGAIDMTSIGRLIALMLAPFALGQMLGKWLGAFAVRHKALLTLNDRGAILLAVYAAFSTATVERIWQRIPPTQLLILLLLCCAVLAFVMLLTWHAGKLLGFTRPDRIALLMCGSKKSLASGVPMASVLLGSATNGLVLLPLMVYHQIQLIVCALIAQRLAAFRSPDR